MNWQNLTPPVGSPGESSINSWSFHCMVLALEAGDIQAAAWWANVHRELWG